MTKKEAEPVLWQAETGQQIRTYKELVAAVNNFAEEYEAIMVEAFTPAIYEHICNQDFAPLEKLFGQKADHAISQTPVFGGLQNQQREHLKGELLRLREAFEGLMKKVYTNPSRGVFLHEIPIVKNRARWTDSDSQRILEKYFTLRLDEKTKELQSLVISFQTAWNDLADHLTGGEAPRPIPAQPFFNYFNPEPGFLLDGFLSIDDRGNVHTDWSVIFEQPTQYKP